MRADLHTHTTASDGTVTPSGLVALALDRRLDVLAITDHDSVEGLSEARDACQACGLELIAACELSAVEDGLDVHILAYWVDPTDPALLDHLADLRAARFRRAEAMVGALVDAGFGVTLDDVLALSDGGAVGRSHVARALVHAGHAEDVADAFKRFIGRGRPFYVPKDSRSPIDVVRTIRDVGAVPVLAHPGVTQADALIPGLVAAGLQGIEAYHADHNPEQQLSYAALADELGLLATGGTDYHGPHSPNPDLGSVTIPDECVSALLALRPGS